MVSMASCPSSSLHNGVRHFYRADNVGYLGMYSKILLSNKVLFMVSSLCLLVRKDGVESIQLNKYLKS